MRTRIWILFYTHRLYAPDLLIQVRCRFWQTTLAFQVARLKQFFKSFHLIYWFGLNKGQLCWFSSCKKIPSPFQCLKPHFVIQISHLFVGEVSLLTQSRGGSNSKVPVLAECSGIQTVMNLGVGMSFTLSSGRFFNFQSYGLCSSLVPQKKGALEQHVGNSPTCQPTLLERVPTHYEISRTLEACIPRQWGLTKILSQATVSTRPKDQRQGTGARATGECGLGEQAGGGTGERVPHCPAGCLPRVTAKQVWAAGGIKGTFGHEFDGTSWPICESHTVVPQSHDLITIYQGIPYQGRRRQMG